MSIRVQPFVIDDAVLDLIGREFKFDHAKGLTEWMKNSSDAYIREQIPDDDQTIIMRVHTTNAGNLSSVECIDYVGMTKEQIDGAFKRFFDPEAAKKGAKDASARTLGGHGNGGKFYMRQMFGESRAITYRNGKLSIFGFNTKRQYGFDETYCDTPVDPAEALAIAGIDGVAVPESERVLQGGCGFTVVRGEKPERIKGSTKAGDLLEKIVMHPQARRLIERKPVSLLIGDQTVPQQLQAPRILPKEEFEDPIVIDIPTELPFQGSTVAMETAKYPWPGRLILKTSNEPLRGKHSTLNTIDVLGEIGVIASYRMHEIGIGRSGQSEFIYGECECPILEDLEFDCVRNDRQKLIENQRSDALLRWIREQVETLADSMEEKLNKEKQRHDLKNTSIFNEMLNRWKNRFMDKLLTDILVGDGPAGLQGLGPGRSGNGQGGGHGGDGSGAHEGGNSGLGDKGGDKQSKRPRFPQVMITGQDSDPLDPLSAEPFECDPRHPAIYQRTQDVDQGIYWINTSRPLAAKIIETYDSDSTRWREYLFQRYVDIIVKESIYQLARTDTSLSADDVNRCIDDITTRIHDEAAKDLGSFLFEEQFGVS